MDDVRKWSRATEPLKRSVFSACSKGYSNSDAVKDNGVSFATVERFYHHTVLQKARYRSNRLCPRLIGIDEHRFTKKVGFATTFCNLEKHSVFDIVPGRSEKDLLSFLRGLKGRKRVRMVCMDILYLFWQDLADLCRNKGKNKKECTLLVQELLSKIEQLKDIEFKPLKTLAKTLKKWINPIARMFHFNHSNGVVEGFHRKMKLIQRRAYGFKNTENYRLRVKVLCS